MLAPRARSQRLKFGIGNTFALGIVIEAPIYDAAFKLCIYISRLYYTVLVD